jgi:hypothetical protein
MLAKKNIVVCVAIHCSTFSFEELSDFGKMNVIVPRDERLTGLNDVNLILCSLT